MAAGEEQALLLMSKMTTKPRSNSASVMTRTGPVLKQPQQRRQFEV